MKKYFALLMIFCLFALTGCSNGVERIFYPNDNEAELYYNTYPDVKNRIKREDVKRNNYYNDLFIAENIVAGMELDDVLYGEAREALLDVSTAQEVYFMPSATGETKLSEWINQSTLKYTFDQDEVISSYGIVNSKSNNTYVEYLYVMRALHLKYGECTTEIYKNEDNIIDNKKVKEDYKMIDELVAFYETEFQDGNVEIVSKWINDGYTITVDFMAGKACSVVYEFKTADTAESED